MRSFRFVFVIPFGVFACSQAAGLKDIEDVDSSQELPKDGTPPSDFAEASATLDADAGESSASEPGEPDDAGTNDASEPADASADSSVSVADSGAYPAWLTPGAPIPVKISVHCTDITHVETPLFTGCPSLDARGSPCVGSEGTLEFEGSISYSAIVNTHTIDLQVGTPLSKPGGKVTSCVQAKPTLQSYCADKYERVPATCPALGSTTDVWPIEAKALAGEYIGRYGLFNAIRKDRTNGLLDPTGKQRYAGVGMCTEAHWEFAGQQMIDFSISVKPDHLSIGKRRHTTGFAVGTCSVTITKK